MALIKLDGSTITSHATATDISQVTNLDQLQDVNIVNGLQDGQVLYYNSGTSKWENNTKLTVDNNTNGNIITAKSVDFESDHHAWTYAASRAVSGDWGAPQYNLRATTSTQWEPATWGTALYELKFDTDLTGVNLDGTAQTFAWIFGDDNNSYDAAGINITMRNTVVDGNGDIESFNAEAAFRVNDVDTVNGTTLHFPLSMDSGQVKANTKLVTEVTQDSSSWGASTNVNRRIYDEDLTGINIDGQSMLTANRVGDLSGNTYPVNKMFSIWDNVTIDGSGYISDFNGEYHINIQDLVAGSVQDTNVIKFKSNEVVIKPTERTHIRRDASTNAPGQWDTLRVSSINHDNGPGWNIIGFDITSNSGQTNWAADMEVHTTNATLDGGGNYTDFNHEYRFYVTDMASSSLSWHNPMSMNSSEVVEQVPHTFVNKTTTERNALSANPGMTIFNTTTSKLETYDGATWQAHW